MFSATTFTLIAIFIYDYFYNKKSYKYFLKIGFDWDEVFELMELSETQKEKLTLNYKDFFSSTNANSRDYIEINSKEANFEYFIDTNGKDTHIFDQQIGCFTQETINAAYSGIFTDKEKELYVGCVFSGFYTGKKSAFLINFTDYSKVHKFSQSSVAIVFDRDLLSSKKEGESWGSKKFEVYSYTNGSADEHKGEDKIKRINLKKENSFYIESGPQSKDEAQAAPLSGIFYSYFEKQK